MFSLEQSTLFLLTSTLHIRFLKIRTSNIANAGIDCTGLKRKGAVVSVTLFDNRIKGLPNTSP